MSDIAEIEKPKRAPVVRPGIVDLVRERRCPECGGPVVRRSARGPFPTFCSPEHKRQHNLRHINEGRAIIGLLKAWRINRGSGEVAQRAFAEVCRAVDYFNAEDLEAGRPRADLYGAMLLHEQMSIVDRRLTVQRVPAVPEIA